MFVALFGGPSRGAVALGRFRWTILASLTGIRYAMSLLSSLSDGRFYWGIFPGNTGTQDGAGNLGLH